MGENDHLAPDETLLFEAINRGDKPTVEGLLEKGINTNCYDSSKMTPLSSAAYKGFMDIVELLLKKNAVVNEKGHEHGYTPLMFAALSGHKDVCKLLMDHGAKSFLTNNIGKTASELAAFVGQHECVSIINNHVGVDEIDVILNTKIAGEVVEKYPAELTAFIHDLCKTHQIHPVSLIFRFCDYKDAMKYKKKILYVIDRVFEKQLRCKEPNEVMSLKLWLILFIIREVVKFVEENDKDPQEAIMLYAKWLLVWEPGEKVRKNLEALLRGAVNAFPYRHSLLFETMMKALSKTAFGSLPSCYDYIIQAIFGQRILACSKFCASCGTPNASKRCAICKIVMFKQEINHLTGERSWVHNEEEFDIAQELARSRFGDMILDHDRNNMFLAGLKVAISEKKSKGQQAVVLDIGTGTGLLSLMAAREGADHVVALEVFKPMAACAKNVIDSSSYKDKIEVISQRSTDLSSLKVKPNIIVAEVFDTELNGEGALRTFKEALTNLTQPGCRVVPCAGHVWATPVNSEFIKKFNKVPVFPFEKNENKNGDDPLQNCPGTAAVFDLQLSQVPNTRFTALSRPVLAFHFDYENVDKIVYEETFVREVQCINSGDVDAIMVWWTLDMDKTGKHQINMAPAWCNRQYAWRDHWMQAIYFLPQKTSVKRGEKYKLHCSHDEFSMWFSIGEIRLHDMFSRQSVWNMNNLTRSPRYLQFSEIFKDKRIVVLGEGSLLGILLAQHAKEVVIVDNNPHFRLILKKYSDYYNFNKKVTIVESADEIENAPYAIIGEPFYLSAMNPFHNFRFWAESYKLRKRLGLNIKVYPEKARCRAIAMCFDNLHKTSASVGTVQGFDLSHFDKISHDVKRAKETTDALVEEHPLWEYSGKGVTNVVDAGIFNLTFEPGDITYRTNFKIRGKANGIAIWIDWDFVSMKKSTGTEDENLEGLTQIILIFV